MSQWTPCKRRDVVRALRALGFEGPFAGKRHQFMILAGRRLAIPSNAEYSVPQLWFMPRDVEGIIGRHVSAAEWERLRSGQTDGAPPG